MTKKRITIFIVTFIITGIVVLGVYFWLTRGKKTNESGETPWYQNFNPFGAGVNIDPTTGLPTEPGTGETPSPITTPTSRFYQITDFAVAGATFLEDIRPIVVDPDEVIPGPQEIEVPIRIDTVEGRKEIQAILNSELSLNPPLPVLGNFGRLTEQAIKDFQKLKNIPETGKIDALTSPYFTKTQIITDEAPRSLTEIAPSVRYVERMNGHIYKMFIDNKTREKISNSTIPAIYEAFFGNKADTVVYRYLSNDRVINSYLATIGQANGEFLPQNISDFSVSPDKNKFFYLTKNTDGVTGILGDFNNINSRQSVFSSAFSEWLTQWDNNQNIYLTAKASYVFPGSFYRLDTTNKTLNKIYGGKNGLTTLVNPGGTVVLFSYATETGPALGIYNISSNTEKN
jgi:peptidoglycan hydrolase-like protein with peptidoglycan-binding domain